MISIEMMVYYNIKLDNSKKNKTQKTNKKNPQLRIVFFLYLANDVTHQVLLYKSPAEHPLTGHMQ